jgi:hypothetical protein
MRNDVLRIIVREHCSPRGCPLEEASEYFSHFKKGIIFGVLFSKLCFSIGNLCDIPVFAQNSITMCITSGIGALSGAGIVG